MIKKHLLCMACALILIGMLGVLPVAAVETNERFAAANESVLAGLSDSPQTAIWSIPQQAEYDPVLGTMISEIDESEMYQSLSDLQALSTRSYPSRGNREAASYIYNRLAAIPGLDVEYQGDGYRNVIATLPGMEETSGKVIVVGAHYDSISPDPQNAPGATDDGCGVAIVLELARVMSQYRYNQTVQFAFWNAEELGMKGSADFVADASENSVDIPLYVNFDSGCYDPDDQYVLDITYNEESEPFAELLTQYNSLYDINFDLTFNVMDGLSDHVSFWQGGYPAIMTHSQSEAPQTHTPDDTVELVSLGYEKKNAQLGMVILATTADQSTRVASPQVLFVPDGSGVPLDLDGDGMYEDVNGNGGTDFADAILYYNQMTWIAANEPVSPFDYDGNDRIDFADVVWLFDNL